ncbi:PP2C family protein-serine/threonine phosphatase [Streptomyces flavofungini]|uniref:PP2C family protein-serine/threonine phosphatase n=1 Tax=Streptomyces flavofungini TaxID=68200 RepID=UPI0025AF2712|nr:PP2C family protein-serine/threonine phosphatase [Streptomyces flavofungini]WJV51714.1 PP2C family protein-serine/threonine phosphatase [Streptomyces flavofungini]
MGVAGRKYGAFKGQTESANELAGWLRQRTQGRTLRQLEEEFGTARTVWSDYLSGAKLIPSELLDRLVASLIREPRLQARMRAEAAALHSAAARPPQVRELSRQRPRSGPEQVNALQRQLTDALERQLEAERALYRSSQLVQTLLTMIAWLQGQCTVLAAERDQALQGDPAQALVHARGELELANQQLVRTQTELARARRERATAEEIKVAAQQAAEAYRKALEAIQRDGGAGEQSTGDQMPRVVKAPAEPSLQDYAAVLDSVSDELDHQHQDLAGLRTRVGLPSDQDADKHIVQGVVLDDSEASGQPGHREVVRGSSADSADNSPALASDVDRPSRADEGWLEWYESLSAEEQQAELQLLRAGDEQHRRDAIALQHNLLPSKLAQIDDLDVLAHYRFGTKVHSAGVDWYDVIPIGGGQVALTVGDVMGPGMRATAVMGQLRSAVRAYARLNLLPGDVLALLNSLADEINDDFNIASCIYAVFDPQQERVYYSSAGHPPLLIRTPEGEVLRGEEEPSLPLGVGAHPYETFSLPLAPGATGMLFTKGLLDYAISPTGRRAGDIEAGLDKLQLGLAAASGSCQAIHDQVLDTLGVAEEHDDDLVMLTFQSKSPLDEEAPRSAAHALSGRETMGGGPHEGSIQDAEEFAVDTLTAWGVGDEGSTRIGAAVGSFVRHALEKGLEPVHVYLRSTKQHLVLQVADASGNMPRRTKGNELHNDHLEQALAKLRSVTSPWSWGARRQNDGGSVVWVELDFPLRWATP